MAQTNFTPIQLYYSATAAATPTAGNLASGELAINITDGRLFYKDNGGVVQVLATKAGASGDVVGPGSSTDNALVRFDGTTGKLVQSSVGVLSDAGALSGLTGLTSSGSITFSGLTSGRLTYATTGGLLTDSANLTFDGTTLTANALTVSNNVTLSGGTANGVAYLNGSKVLTTGSALTFDGTSMATTSLGYDINNANALVRFYNGSGTRRGYIQVRSDAFEIWSDQSAVPVVFGQNNSEQMRLTSTGLGIGTSSPGAKLDVQGAGAVIQLKQNATGSATYYVMDNTVETGGKRWRFGYTGATGIPLFSLYNQTDNVLAWAADSSGNLGLGVTPSASTYKNFQINTTGILGTASGYIWLGNNWVYNSGDKYIANGTAQLFGLNDGGFQWFTAPSGTAGNAISFTQAMTLDASGNLLVGTTGAFFSAQYGGIQVRGAGLGAVTRQTALISSFAYSTSVGLPIYAGDWASSARWGIGPDSGSNDSTIRIGIITSDGSGAYWSGGYANVKGGTYTNASDYRIKKNVQSVLSPVLPNLMQVRPVSYNVIRHDDAGTEQSTPKEIGFIAHELQEFFPEFVTGVKDEVDVEGKPQIQAVDYAKFTAVLVKAIQEQQTQISDQLAIINAQQAELAQLKARLDAANL